MDYQEKADMARRLYNELGQDDNLPVGDDDKEIATGVLYENEGDYIDDVAKMSEIMYATTKSLTCERFDKADNLYKNYLMAMGIKDRDDIYLWHGDKGCYADFILKDINGGWCGFKRRRLGYIDGELTELGFDNNAKAKWFILGNAKGKLMMYGLANVVPIGDIYLVEGEKDAAIMNNAVGAVQDAAMGETLAYLIDVFPTHKIKVVPDNDKTKTRVMKLLNRNNHNRFKMIHLPRGIKDIGEYYLKHGDYEKEELDIADDCDIMADNETELERSFDIVDLPEKNKTDNVLFRFDKAEAPVKVKTKAVRVKKEKTLLQMIKSDDFVNAIKTFGAVECFNLLRTENE